MIKIISVMLGLSIIFVTPTFAHVVVKPNQASIGSFQTFSMGVPNEKDNPTVALRLVIPDGLNYVSPNVKPGWTIEVKKTEEGEEGKVTEINWTGGSIPAGQRDDFVFSAQVPVEETTITWKAYQTYEDGEVVAWDQDPKHMKNLSDEAKEENEQHGNGPYSQTTIVNDLTEVSKPSEKEASAATTLSIVALVLAIISLVRQTNKK